MGYLLFKIKLFVHIIKIFKLHSYFNTKLFLDLKNNYTIIKNVTIFLLLIFYPLLKSSMNIYLAFLCTML